MRQLPLFGLGAPPRRLDACIERNGDELLIPEGIPTIPATHGIHRFAGKFIPNIPRYLLRCHVPRDPDRIVMDPFCGSGTTLVEAALEGSRFVGIDIDPLAVAISRVKTQTLSEDDLAQLEAHWRQHDYSVARPEFVPRVHNLSHWFSDTAILELSSIKASCLELPPSTRWFSLIVFSSIIRRVSNADDQTQKTYVSHTLPKKPPLPSVLFPIFLGRAIESMREYKELLPRPARGCVHRADAVDGTKSIDFHDVVTSPPYIDSIDYLYNHMLEYYWLLEELGVNSYEAYRNLRRVPMGCRIYAGREGRSLVEEKLRGSRDLFERICSQIGAKSPREEEVVRSFFFDYARHVREVRAVQPRDGRYICVVGNSRIRGVDVPTVEFVQQVHLNSGYTLSDRLTYRIRRHYMKFPRRTNSGRIDRDHILVFKVDA